MRKLNYSNVLLVDICTLTVVRYKYQFNTIQDVLLGQ